MVVSVSDVIVPSNLVLQNTAWWNLKASEVRNWELMEHKLFWHGLIEPSLTCNEISSPLIFELHVLFIPGCVSVQKGRDVSLLHETSDLFSSSSRNLNLNDLVEKWSEIFCITIQRKPNRMIIAKKYGSISSMLCIPDSENKNQKQVSEFKSVPSTNQVATQTCLVVWLNIF